MLATLPPSPALHSPIHTQRSAFDYDFPVSLSTMEATPMTTTKNHTHTRTNYRTLSPSAAAAAAQKGRARGPSFASTSSSSSSSTHAYYPATTGASSSTNSPSTRRPSAASRLPPSWERGYDDDDEYSVDSADEFDADTDAFAYSYQYDHPPSAYVTTSRGTSLASRQLQQKKQSRKPRSRSQSPFADADPLAPISHSSSYYADSPRSLALSLPPLSVSYEEESPLRTMVLSEEYQAELRRERERELEKEREKEKVASFEGYRKLTLGLGMRRKKYGGWDLDAENLDAEKEMEQSRRFSLEEHPTTYQYDYDMDAAVEDEEAADRLHDDDMRPEYTPSCTQIVHRRWQALSLSWRTSVFRAKRRLRRRVGL